MTPQGKQEVLSEKLHIWYLEATARLTPENYNKKAQISYAELSDEQKYIDRYIANKILSHIDSVLPTEDEIVEILLDPMHATSFTRAKAIRQLFEEKLK